ncbi:MAG: hypothetical protein JWM85_2249, partial [Acidimicrobiaceae bacterium]|nr:hypothetical protein [Acidimicrobiaceae bacterium]
LLVAALALIVDRAVVGLGRLVTPEPLQAPRSQRSLQRLARRELAGSRGAL